MMTLPTVARSHDAGHSRPVVTMAAILAVACDFPTPGSPPIKQNALGSTPGHSQSMGFGVISAAERTLSVVGPLSLAARCLGFRLVLSGSKTTSFHITAP